MKDANVSSFSVSLASFKEVLYLEEAVCSPPLADTTANPENRRIQIKHSLQSKLKSNSLSVMAFNSCLLKTINLMRIRSTFGCIEDDSYGSDNIIATNISVLGIAKGL